MKNFPTASFIHVRHMIKWKEGESEFHCQFLTVKNVNLTVKNVIDSEKCVNDIFHCQWYFSLSTDRKLLDVHFHCQMLIFFTVKLTFSSDYPSYEPKVPCGTNRFLALFWHLKRNCESPTLDSGSQTSGYIFYGTTLIKSFPKINPRWRTHKTS